MGAPDEEGNLSDESVNSKEATWGTGQHSDGQRPV